jgi:hypothetical protein
MGRFGNGICECEPGLCDQRKGCALMMGRSVDSDDKPVLNILRQSMTTFAQRNAQYGGNWDRTGRLILALFPEGGVPAISSEEDANRLNLIIDCAAKLQRYAHAFGSGGHRDSAEDLIIYAAKLAEVTK